MGGSSNFHLAPLLGGWDVDEKEIECLEGPLVLPWGLVTVGVAQEEGDSADGADFGSWRQSPVSY